MRTSRIKFAFAAIAVTVALAGNGFAEEKGWLEDFSQAAAVAKKENKPMLVDFTSSDSCPACIMMKKAVFDAPVFQKYATDNLVLLKVDFPQREGNMLPPEQMRQNEALAEKFGIVDENGILNFPTLVVVTPAGQIVAMQKGAFTDPSEFISWTQDALKKSRSAG